MDKPEHKNHSNVSPSNGLRSRGPAVIDCSEKLVIPFQSQADKLKAIKIL